MKNLILSIFTLMVMAFWLPANAQESNPSADPSTANMQSQAPPDRDLLDLLDYADPNNLLPEEQALFTTIFGGFILSPTGQGDTTVLTQAVGFTSVAAMIMGVLIIAYLIPASAIHTASSGEPLGRQWSSIWLPARVCIGFGMMMPAAAGGQALSVIQFLALKAFFIGSGMASHLWVETSESIINYESSIVSPAVAPKLGGYIDLANSAICSAQEKFRVSASGTHSSLSRPQYVMKIYDAQGNKSTITNRQMPGSDSFMIPDGSVIASIEFSASGICGSMDMFPRLSDETHPGAWAAYQNTSAEIAKTLNHYSQLAMTVHSDKMGSAIIEIANNNDVEGGDKVKEYVAEMKVAISEHASGYPARMMEAINNGFKLTVDENSKESILAYDSWLFAGNHAFNLASYGSAKGAAAIVVNKVIANGSWRSCGEGVVGCKNAEDVSRTDAALGTRSSSIIIWVDIVEETVGGTTIQAAPGVNPDASGVVCSGKGCDGLKWINDLTNDMHVTLLNAITGVGEAASGETTHTIKTSVFDTTGNTNPYLVMANLGHGLNAVLVGSWTVGLIAATVAGAADGSIAGWFGAGAASGALDYVLSTIGPVFQMAILAGAVMAYVIPILIAMRWLFAILNYLLIIIEALTAAPIWIAMMITPEGEGISGARAERGLVIFAQILLQPVLMIIALYASIVIAQIGFMMVNTMWFADPTAYNNNGLFDFVYKLIFWVGLQTSVLWFASAPITTFPTAIADWMGGGIARAMDNQVEGKITDISSKTEGMAGSAMQSAGGAIGRARQKAST